jgi:hypothetical protein
MHRRDLSAVSRIGAPVTVAFQACAFFAVRLHSGGNQSLPAWVSFPRRTWATDRMNPKLHHKIADKLEAAKASGLIRDYLVSWVGFGGQLDPVVSGWKSPGQSDESVQQRITTLLSGLVSAQNVRVRTE